MCLQNRVWIYQCWLPMEVFGLEGQKGIAVEAGGVVVRVQVVGCRGRGRWVGGWRAVVAHESMVQVVDE